MCGKKFDYMYFHPLPQVTPVMCGKEFTEHCLGHRALSRTCVKYEVGMKHVQKYLTSGANAEFSLPHIILPHIIYHTRSKFLGYYLAGYNFLKIHNETNK